MKVLSCLPIVWAIVWSIFAISLALRSSGHFTHGPGRRQGPPSSSTRIFFLLGAAYCLFWAFVSILKQFASSSSASFYSSHLLDSFQHRWGLIAVDVILLVAFGNNALGYFLILRNRDVARRDRHMALLVSCGLTAIFGLILWSFVHELVLVRI